MLRQSNFIFLSRSASWWLGAALVGLAGLLRWGASRGDFWFDEVWTWLLVFQDVRTDWDVVTRVQIDNNHFLNTWMIFRLGLERHWTVYRLPAVLAGTAAVLFAGWQGAQRSVREMLLALLLTGGSFLLIHYSSEARGYGYLMGCTMLTCFALQRFERNLGWGAGLAVSVGCVLGFLAQFTFAFCYLAVGVWTMIAVIRNPSGRRCLGYGLLHVPPLALLLTLYVVHQPKVGGADIIPTLDVIRMAFALAAGGPQTGPLSWGVAGVMAALLGVSLCHVWKVDRLRGAFYASAILAGPVVVVLVTGYAHLLPRHLLIPILFAQLLAAEWLASPHVWSGGRRVFLCGMLLVWGAANALALGDLFQHGRGRYVAALRYMAQHSHDPHGYVLVGSDHDDRNSMLINFFAAQSQIPGRDFPELGKVRYVPQGQFQAVHPEWFVVHSQAARFDPPPDLNVAGMTYTLRQMYRYSTLSGWHWGVYQRQGEVPVKPEASFPLR